MIRTSLGLLTLAIATLSLSVAGHGEEKESKKVDTRVFELRTYHAYPGKMKALQARFADHTIQIFQKHGMTVIGFWVPADPKGAEEQLVYILAFPSKDAAAKSWAAFRTDPAWIKAKADSEKEGPLVMKVDSVYLNPTTFSPIK